MFCEIWFYTVFEDNLTEVPHLRIVADSISASNFSL